MRLHLLLAVSLSLLVSQEAHADTIVLKNGRRIVALSVAVEGDKVRYLTPAGELALPKSIVDHIEKGGPGQMPASPSVGAANLAITPPSVEASGANAAVESGAVHDGIIDRDFLAAMASEAQSGAPGTSHKAALAYHAVAQFELSRGDMERALNDERTALSYAPDDAGILLNVAYLHLRRSENKQGLEYLERAQRVAPNNPDISKLAGWAYYGMNKLNQAVGNGNVRWRCGRIPKYKRRSTRRYATNEKKKIIARTRAATLRCATAVRRSPGWRMKCFAPWKRILPPSNRN